MSDAEYLCLTLTGHEGETESAFKSRLTAAWTVLLRTAPDTYETVFAEAKEFASVGGQVSLSYMIEADTAEAVAKALVAQGLAAQQIDPDDVYSRYEAS